MVPFGFCAGSLPAVKKPPLKVRPVQYSFFVKGSRDGHNLNGPNPTS